MRNKCGGRIWIQFWRASLKIINGGSRFSGGYTTLHSFIAVPEPALHFDSIDRDIIQHE